MFKTTFLIVSIATLFIFSNAYSQDKTIDSIKIVLQNPKVHDTTKLSMLGMTMDTNYTENDPTYYYLNDLIGNIARKNLKKDNSPELQSEYTLWLSTYYNALAIQYMHKRDPKALVYIDKSIVLAKSVKDFGTMYYRIIVKGTFYSKFNENHKGIACIFTALKYFEKNKKENLGEIAYAMISLASIYADQDEHQKSIAVYKKVLGYYDEETGMPLNQKNYFKSYVYTNLSSSYASLKNYPEVIKCATEALNYARKTGDKTVESIVLTRIGLAKMEQFKFDESENLLKQSLAASTDEMAISNVYTALGKLHYKKKELDKADFYTAKGLALSKKNNFLDLQEQGSALLFNISKDRKNFEKALEMHEFHDLLTDSTKIEASKNAMAQQQLQYDFEKKELTLKLDAEKKNAAKNNWLIALSSLLLLILLGGYFYYRNNRQKQAINVLEKKQMKQKLLVTQMNPHFIFNSIENIRSLIYANQNNDAVNYLGKFSKLTRQILENSNENYISLAEEIEMTENYLSIQQLLYNNKFNFNINVEDSIETDSIFLPPMLTQPFIENAIKHGLSDTTQNGLVDIRFYLKENRLFFEVSDNGKGFDDHKNANHKSLAMTITKERLVTYTKNQDFVVETANIIGENENIIGAKVLFEIPYIYEN